MVGIARELSAGDYEQLPANDKELYAAGEGGKFIFIGENAGELKRGKLRLSEDNKNMRDKMSELEKKIKGQDDANADADKARKAADAEKLDAAWKGKYDADVGTRDAKIAALEANIIRQHKAAVISELVAKHALPDKRGHLELYLKQHLRTELGEDGSPKVIVRDADEKDTTLTVDKMMEELHNDTSINYSLRGTSGSGADDKPTGNNPPTPTPAQPIGDHGQPTKLTLAEKIANPIKFAKEIAARKAAGVSTIPDHEKKDFKQVYGY